MKLRLLARLTAAAGLLCLAAPNAVHAEKSFEIYYPDNSTFGSPLSETTLRKAKLPKKTVSQKRAPASVKNATRSPAAALFDGPSATPVKREARPRWEYPSIVMPDREPAAPLFDPVDPISTVKRSSGLSFIPQFFYTRLDGQDLTNGGRSVLLSNINLGGEVQWSQTWSDSIRSYMGVAVTKLTLKTTTQTQVAGSDQIYTNLRVGLQYAPADWADLEFTAGVSEEIFIRASSTALINVDKVMVPQLNAGLTLDLITLYPFLIGTSFTGVLLFPNSTETHIVTMGYGYRAKLKISEATESEAVRWSGALFFGQTLQDTSINRQKRRDLGLEIGLRWGGKSE